MRKTAAISLLAVLLTGGCGPGEEPVAPAAERDTTRVLAVVGNLDITEKMVEAELSTIPIFQRDSYESPQGRRILVDQLVEREVLLIAASELNLESDPFVVAQVETATRQVEEARTWAMIQAYYREMGIEDFRVPEEAVQEYYDRHSVDIYLQREQVRVSQIMVTVPTDTATVSAALNGGKSFATVAAKLSSHRPTSGTGGDLGWVTVGSSLPYLGDRPEISASLFAAAPGEQLGPFHTELGWHYFTVTDRREEGALPLYEVRSRIENTVMATHVDSYLHGELIPALAEEYGVTVNEEAFVSNGSDVTDDLDQR